MSLPPRSTEFVGISPWAVATRNLIHDAARNFDRAFIHGPQGTGKQLIAAAIHSQSPRASAPFVHVDCRKLVGGPAGSQLFASQLFGQQAGCGSYGQGATLGCLRAAASGTLFLYGMAALDLDSQQVLATTLATGKINPLGADEPVALTARIIAAGHCDPEQDVVAGRLLPELHAQFAGLSIATFELARRIDDIEVLLRHFLAQHENIAGSSAKSLTAAAILRIRGYVWPGNVRQLKSVADRLAALPADTIGPATIERLMRACAQAPPKHGHRPARKPADVAASAESGHLDARQNRRCQHRAG